VTQEENKMSDDGLRDFAGAALSAFDGLDDDEREAMRQRLVSGEWIAEQREAARREVQARRRDELAEELSALYSDPVKNRKKISVLSAELGKLLRGGGS
jgi:hypothetical protein